MAERKLDYREYPAADGFRSGIKVGWRIYRKERDAKACAEVAKHNAKIAATLGFDFGYQTPGSITQLEDGRFEVVVP